MKHQKDLDNITIVAINNFMTESKCLTSNEEYFDEVEFDAVLISGEGSGIVIVEVALGGQGRDFKAGPKRKMLTDILKLQNAEIFLKDKSQVIHKKILIVRDTGVLSRFNGGWHAKVLAQANIEVVAALLTNEERLIAEHLVYVSGTVGRE